MSFPLYEFQLFMEVARVKNLTRASERLGIGQSALSQAIKRLEHFIGTPLLIRSKSGVFPNKMGELLIKEGKSPFDELSNLPGKLKQSGENPSGEYILGMHQSVALFSLVHFLPKLINNYQNLEIRLVHDFSRIITEQVVSFNVDIGLVMNPVQHPDLIIKNLGQETSTLWIHKSIQGKTDKNFPLIYTPEHIQAVQIQNELSKHNYSFRRSIRTPNYEVVKDLVLNKVGVGVLPFRTLSGKELQSIIPFNEKGPFFHENFCLVYRYELLKTHAAKIIVNFIENKMKEYLLKYSFEKILKVK